MCSKTTCCPTLYSLLRLRNKRSFTWASPKRGLDKFAKSVNYRYSNVSFTAVNQVTTNTSWLNVRPDLLLNFTSILKARLISTKQQQSYSSISVSAERSATWRSALLTLLVFCTVHCSFLRRISKGNFFKFNLLPPLDRGWHFLSSLSDTRLPAQ